jgi:hypothetical protein
MEEPIAQGLRQFAARGARIFTGRGIRDASGQRPCLTWAFTVRGSAYGTVRRGVAHGAAGARVTV